MAVEGRLREVQGGGEGGMQREGQEVGKLQKKMGPWVDAGKETSPTVEMLPCSQGS